MDTVKKENIMQDLLLPDADVIIDLHKLGYWNGVIANYALSVSSVVIREVKFYDDPIDRQRKQIDLQSFVNSNKMVQVSASPQELTKIISDLDKADLVSGKLDAGELECIAIMDTNRMSGLTFCAIDAAAIKAVSYLGLDDRALSVEEVLKNCGIIKVKDALPPKYSKARFQKIVTEGRFLAIEVERMSRS
jgi:hypothetical protein